jgi:hypothetical protein
MLSLSVEQVLAAAELAAADTPNPKTAHTG